MFFMVLPYFELLMAINSNYKKKKLLAKQMLPVFFSIILFYSGFFFDRRQINTGNTLPSREVTTCTILLTTAL